MNHFDELACMLYLDGQLEPERSRELLRHTAECGDCRKLLRALEEESDRLRVALWEDTEAMPAGLARSPGRSRTSWIWIVAFGLASSGVYTFWNGLIAPWQQQLSDAGLNSNNLLTMLVFRGAFWKGWDSMRSLVEFIALATLISLVIGLTRRSWRHWSTVALVLSSLFCVLGLPGIANAAGAVQGGKSSVSVSVGDQSNGPLPAVQMTIRGAPNYTLAPGETQDSDAIVFADFVHIDGTVEGDVIAFAQDVEISGHVKGDVLAFTRNLRISGQVDGNVRSYSQFTDISGTVGRNVTAGCEIFQLDRTGKIGWGLLMGGRDAILSGTIGRNVLSGTDTTEIDGSIGGNVTMKLDRATIGSGADIRGVTRITGRHRPEVSPGAKLGSPVQFTQYEKKENFRTGKYYLHRALYWGAAFVFGMVLLLLWPGLFERVIHAGRQKGSLIGFLVLPGVPLIAIIACITLVGIPLGILALVLYIVALYASQVFVGELVGGMLLGPGGTFTASLGRLALGLLLIHVLASIPFIGGWVVFLVMVWGLGAITLALYRGMRTTAATA